MKNSKNPSHKNYKKMITTAPEHKTTPSTKTTREQRLKSVKESKIPF
ncbi:flagellar basal body rod FlgG domain protein [Helicobacter pylori CCHI 33]|nr:flagellar basal body rod FlgG domain protein [Helicobacter pylori Hp H-36]EMR58123.1 flagellar basal body rod FlgG domain protein [Helicobacter pylori CCHI 33]